MFWTQMEITKIMIWGLISLLGCKDISTMMVYSRLSQDHLRGAVERLEF